MVRSRLSMSQKPESRPMVVSDRRKQTDLSIGEFLQLHEKFMRQKSLEGAASRIIKDHVNHMKYFRQYSKWKYLLVPAFPV